MSLCVCGADRLWNFAIWKAGVAVLHVAVIMTAAPTVFLNNFRDWSSGSNYRGQEVILQDQVCGDRRYYPPVAGSQGNVPVQRCFFVCFHYPVQTEQE